MKAIVFTSKYCPYCRHFETVVERLKKEINIEFEIVDVDEKWELAEKFEVVMLPTLVLINKGEVVGGFMGFADYNTALEAMKEQISEIQKI
jgi:thioredoxin 1